MKIQAIIIWCLFTCVSTSMAQLNPTDSLYQVVAMHDSLLYDAAFNIRDGEELKKYLSDDLEFYHDKGGLIATSNNDLIIGFNRNWEKMRAGQKKFQRRELIKGSIEIFSLAGFGAMVIGKHNFYEYYDNEEEVFDSTAQYITIWHNADGQWKAKRIVSYDHR